MKLFNKFSQHLTNLLPIIAIQQIKNEWIITVLPEIIIIYEFSKKTYWIAVFIIICISGVDF